MRISAKAMFPRQYEPLQSSMVGSTLGAWVAARAKKDVCDSRRSACWCQMQSAHGVKPDVDTYGAG